MTAVAFGPTSCPSGLVLKSELLHSPEAQYGFVPKHCRHGGKNIALRAEKPITSPSPSEGGEHGSFPLGRSGEVLFFSEAMFLLLDVCNNDSYVIRAVAWA